MDSYPDDAARLREARLQHIEALEGLLNIAARLLVERGGTPASYPLAARVVAARDMAGALYREINADGQPISDISRREPDSPLG